MTTIQVIPDHILLVETFSLLSVKSLINVSQVCERWSSLIKTSPTLMNRFTLRLTSINNDECFVQNSIPGGLHSNLCIQKLPHGLDKKANQIHYSTIKNHLSYLKSVEFKNFFDNLWKYCKSLRVFTTKIEDVKFIDSTFECKSIFEEELYEWSKLKPLRVEKSYYGFMSIFIKSKLTKLELIHTDVNPHLCVDSIASFWDIQSQFLTELRIINSPVDHKKILKVLELKNLKTFETDLRNLAVNPDLMSELAKVYKWKKLRFKGMPFNRQIVRMIIESHSNLKKISFNLVMFEDNEEILLHIFTSQPSIEHLRLSLNHGKFPNAPIILNKLHTLEIEGVRYQTHVNRVIELLKLSQNLKTLKVYWIGGHALNPQLFLNILRSAPNLETLHLGGDKDCFEISVESLLMMKSECKNLTKFTTFTDDLERMRLKMNELHDSRIKCTALSRVYEDIYASEKLMRTFVHPHPKAKLISTCEWKV